MDLSDAFCCVINIYFVTAHITDGDSKGAPGPYFSYSSSKQKTKKKQKTDNETQYVDTET